jgi:hypothetical protein
VTLLARELMQGNGGGLDTLTGASHTCSAPARIIHYSAVQQGRCEVSSDNQPEGRPPVLAARGRRTTVRPESFKGWRYRARVSEAHLQWVAERTHTFAQIVRLL